MWVGLNEWLIEVSWLGKLAVVFWWVELNLFSVDKCPVVNSEVSVGWCDFCCLYFNAQGYVPAFVKN